MQQFKLIFRYDFNPNYQPTAAEMESESQKWGQWIGGLAQNGSFVGTSQLGYTGKVLAADGNVTNQMHMNQAEVTAGDMTVNANDFDHALEMAKGSPILNWGGSVEIREVIPM